MDAAFAKPIMLQQAQDLRDVLAVHEAARGQEKLIFRTHRTAVAMWGLAYWAQVLREVREEYPLQAFEIWVDVGSHAGVIQRAIAMGFNPLVCQPAQHVRAALEDIAAQAGVVLVCEPMAELMLG